MIIDESKNLGLDEIRKLRNERNILSLQLNEFYQSIDYLWYLENKDQKAYMLRNSKTNLSRLIKLEQIENYLVYVPKRIEKLENLLSENIHSLLKIRIRNW